MTAAPDSKNFGMGVESAALGDITCSLPCAKHGCGRPLHEHADGKPCTLSIGGSSLRFTTPKSPKPCPACEGTDIVLGSSLGESPWRLLCRNPGCWYAGPWQKTIAEADAAWDAMPRKDANFDLLMEIGSLCAKAMDLAYGAELTPPLPTGQPSAVETSGTLSEPDQSGSRIRLPESDEGDLRP